MSAQDADTDQRPAEQTNRNLDELAGLALISAAAVLLIFDVVVGDMGSVNAASAVALAFIALGKVVPSIRGTAGRKGS